MPTSEKPPATVASMLARLDALERANRNLRRLAAFSLIALAAGLALSDAVLIVRTRSAPTAAAPPASGTVIEAEAFVVRGPHGRVRATLGRFGDSTDDNHAQPGLMLFARDGKECASFMVDSHDWGTVSLGDAQQKDRMILSGGGTYDLETVDSGGKPKVQIGRNALTGGGAVPFLSVFDQKNDRIEFLDDMGHPSFLPKPNNSK